MEKVTSKAELGLFMRSISKVSFSDDDSGPWDDLIGYYCVACENN